MKKVCDQKKNHVVRTCKSDYLQQLGASFFFCRGDICCLEVFFLVLVRYEERNLLEHIGALPKHLSGNRSRM